MIVPKNALLISFSYHQFWIHPIWSLIIFTLYQILIWLGNLIYYFSFEICFDSKFTVQGEILKKCLSLIILKILIRSPLILLSSKVVNPNFSNLSL